MFDIYHDWLLVIAAYNCGPGNVNRAIVRSGGKMNFWDICQYLPRETRGYVPAFIAVTYLMNYCPEHNLAAIPPVISFFEADTVLVNQKVSLLEIAHAVDMPLDLLAYLNPIYKRGVIPGSDEPYTLRLPSNKINSYLYSIDKLYASTGEPTIEPIHGSSFKPMEFVTKELRITHVVKRNEQLSSVAAKYNCSVDDLKRWNKIKGGKVFRGQRLVVFATIRQQAEVRSEAAKNADTTTASVDDTSIAAQPLASTSAEKIPVGEKFIWHVVQPGDTLWNIARRYEGVTVDELKAINNLTSSTLKPGTRLKVKVGG
jgi:membrane-bound lytic murein transglycosylase D